jgi:hypothetical protein
VGEVAAVAQPRDVVAGAEPLLEALLELVAPVERDEARPLESAPVEQRRVGRDRVGEPLRHLGLVRRQRVLRVAREQQHERRRAS